MINCCFHSSVDLIQNTNLFLGCVKLLKCFASAVNAVTSNPYVGPSTRIKISLFLLSICTDEPI